MDKFMHYVCDRLEAMMRNSVEHGPVINKLTKKREKFVSVDVIDEFLQEIILNIGVNQRIERKKSGEIFLEDLQIKLKRAEKGEIIGNLGRNPQPTPARKDCFGQITC